MADFDQTHISAPSSGGVPIASAEGVAGPTQSSTLRTPNARRLKWIAISSELRKCAAQAQLHVRRTQPELDGLGPLECLALAVLLEAPDGVAIPSNLAKQIGATRSAMTKASDRLVSRKLVDRAVDQEDRRRIELRMTQEGAALAFLVQQTYRRVEERLESAFSDDEVTALQGLLARLFITLGE